MGVTSSQQPVPPDSSSHTEADGNRFALAPGKQVIKVAPMAYFGCAFGLFIVLFLVLAAPLALGWLLLIPLFGFYWVARVRTIVDEDGVIARAPFATTTVPWSKVAGIRFRNRKWARLVLTDGKEVALPNVGFKQIRLVAAASGGRIPDLYADAAATWSAEDDAAQS